MCYPAELVFYNTSKVIKVGDLLNADGTFNEKSLTEMEGLAEKTISFSEFGSMSIESLLSSLESLLMTCFCAKMTTENLRETLVERLQR